MYQIADWIQQIPQSYMSDGISCRKTQKNICHRKQSAEKESNFTFTGGADFFVEGDTSQENPCEDFFTYMKEKYDNCFKVTNVDDYNLIPHIEVGGA